MKFKIRQYVFLTAAENEVSEINFNNMKLKTRRLYHMLPQPKTGTNNTRNTHSLPLPNCKIRRCKTSSYHSVYSNASNCDLNINLFNVVLLVRTERWY